MAEYALDFVMEYNKVNPHTYFRKKSILVGDQEPLYKGFNVIQVDAWCISEGCVIKNHLNETTLAASKKGTNNNKTRHCRSACDQMGLTISVGYEFGVISCPIICVKCYLLFK